MKQKENGSVLSWKLFVVFWICFEFLSHLCVYMKTTLTHVIPNILYNDDNNNNNNNYNDNVISFAFYVCEAD